MVNVVKGRQGYGDLQFLGTPTSDIYGDGGPIPLSEIYMDPLSARK